MRHSDHGQFEPCGRPADAACRTVRSCGCRVVPAQPADLFAQPSQVGRPRRGLAATRDLSGQGSHDVTAASDAMGARLRPLLTKLPVVEKKMFGGLGFMLNGNMLIGTTAKGD